MNDPAYSWLMGIGMEKIGGIKVKVVSGGYGLCSCITLALKSSKCEPQKVEKGPSTHPINATCFVEK
jgi:hypothetical protein